MFCVKSEGVSTQKISCISVDYADYPNVILKMGFENAQMRMIPLSGSHTRNFKVLSMVMTPYVGIISVFKIRICGCGLCGTMNARLLR